MWMWEICKTHCVDSERALVSVGGQKLVGATLSAAKIWHRMTASVLKQDPNTKRFKPTLIYFDTVCKFSGKSPLSSHKMTLKQQTNSFKLYFFVACFLPIIIFQALNKRQNPPIKVSFSLSFFIIGNCLSVKCYFVAWQKGFPQKFAYFVSVSK